MQADQKQITRLLRTARGQLDGILKMVEDDRYCIDISTQLLAVESVLKKANRAILIAHMQHCVKQSFEEGHAEEKIEEILSILDKMSK